MLNEVSGDRIRHEFDLILEEPQAPEMLARINSLNLFHPFFTKLKWDPETLKILRKYYQEKLPEAWFPQDYQKNILKKANGAYILLMAKASQIDILKILQWLRLKNHLAQMIIQTNMLWHQLSSLKRQTPSQATKKLEDYSQLEIYCVWLLCSDNQIRKTLEDFAQKWRWIKPYTDGSALQKRGLKPGPDYTDILQQLKAAWLDEKIKTKEEEFQYLKNLLKKKPV